MDNLNRRLFLGVAALTYTGLATTRGEAAPEETDDVTGALARYAVRAKLSEISTPVRKEACRTLLNWLGCAIGGSRQPAVENAVQALMPFAGSGKASILGRREKMDALNASLINGLSSHVLDFDDTHLRTIIHPAGPVAPAILALAEHQHVSGQDLLAALIVGVEVECRIGNAVYPAHYDAGWHITGSVGPFGAAAATGRLLGLSDRQMLWALGLAAVQPVGLREMFGTMTKSFHPGRAAQNGFTAAVLASKNFTSSEHALEAKNGWANVLSTAHKFSEITNGLGQTYEISLNTYKPFACGIVAHPIIDACIQLRTENKLDPAKIARIDITVNRLVLELMGKKTPQTGLEGKFSIYHAAAVAIVEGAAGERQFSDAAVARKETVDLRARVIPTIDPAVHEDQASVRITLRDGHQFERAIQHAVGSVTNPMSDRQLEQKFKGLADGIMKEDAIQRLIELCWKVESLPDAAVLAQTARAQV
jgi:2-methylcitrate dehydratase PrpD